MVTWGPYILIDTGGPAIHRPSCLFINAPDFWQRALRVSISLHTAGSGTARGDPIRIRRQNNPAG